MIGKLRGVFEDITSDGAVLIDVRGVGYTVRTPISTIDSLRALQSMDVSLYIHTVVREDAIDLYGFLTKEELSFFKQLTSVSGIGPKTALGILNVSDVRSLKQSIARGDPTTLTKVFGIGKKSAERVVVELRDKLAAAQSEEEIIESGDTEVLEVLIALGYRSDEARGVLKVLVHEGGLQNVSERVSAALKRLGSKAGS